MMRLMRIALVCAVVLGMSSTPAVGITNGTPAEPGKYPFVVALVEPGYAAIDSQFCGGSLISSEWVLTAAHCVTRKGGRPMRADRIDTLIGRTRLSRRGGERIAVRDVVVAPGKLDLALLRLAGPSAVVPALLPGRDDSAFTVAGTTATVIGWGDTVNVDEEDPDADGLPADDLLVATVPFVPQTRCERVMAIDHNAFGVATELCAGNIRSGGADACTGDSGGPLLVGTRFGWVEVGVVAWGDGCGLPHSPGVYTRVATASHWIASTVSR
ncbi:MAG: serine protease [Acidimicrobiia bacterium]|nr:serine protease [Acidimicrobiia bacterium]